MKYLKRLGLLLSVGLLVTVQLLTFGIPRASADVSNPDLDVARRQVANLHKCLTGSMGVTGQYGPFGGHDFKFSADIFKVFFSFDSTTIYTVQRENMTVGLGAGDGSTSQDGNNITSIDKDSQVNGIQTCLMTMEQGLNVLIEKAVLPGPALDDSGSKESLTTTGDWFSKWFFNASPSTSTGGKVVFDKAQFVSQLTVLTSKINAYLTSAGAPSIALIRQRYLSLINACFVPEKIPSRATNARDIQLNSNGGWLMLRKLSDIKANWDKLPETNKQNPNWESDPNVTIADIPLGWQWDTSDSLVDVVANPLPTSGEFGTHSDFWPIGTDLPSKYITNPDHGEGMAECDDIARHPELYEPYSVNDSNQLVGEDGVPVGNGGLDGKAPTIELNCSFSLANALNYFMCPLVEGASHAVTALDAEINDQLTIPVGSGSYFDENSSATGGSAMYQAWSIIRNISLSLLVIIALIMVISQAVSAGAVDAYTIKKVLPRIVVAVIGVTLSWQLTKFLIGISNDLGLGIRSIITTPFRDLGGPEIGNAGQTVGLAAGIVGFFSGIDLIVILSFVLTAFAGVLTAFLVITFRSILAILLVITAPLAIILWILPNTQKAWGFWKGNFEAVLLSFPIIVGFIYTGRIFSVLAYKSQDPGFFRDIIIFIAYFGPYFALPAAFKLAGGAIATIGGMANDRSKGFFDRSRKFRDNRKKEIGHRRAAGNTFTHASETGLRARLNKGIGTAYATKNLGYDPRKWGGQLHRTHTNHSIAAANAMLKDEENARAGDDNWNYAAMLATDSNDFRSKMHAIGRRGHDLDEDVAHYELMRERYGQDGMRLAAYDRAAAGGTVFGVNGNMSSIEAAKHLAGTNSGIQAYLAGRIRGISNQAGRPDEGAINHGAAMAIANSVTSGYSMNQHGQYLDAGGQVLADDAPLSSRVDIGTSHMSGAEKTEHISNLVARRSFQQSHGSVFMGQGVKDQATRKAVGFVREDLGNAVRSGDKKDLARALVKFDQMYSAPGATPDKIDMLADAVSSQVFKAEDFSADIIEMLGGDDIFRTFQTTDDTGNLVETKGILGSELLNRSRATTEVQELSRQYERPYGQPQPPEGGAAAAGGGGTA